ncbi:MAG: hypothetical protein ACK4I8_06105 [Armatimonadota bacterium]
MGFRRAPLLSSRKIGALKKCPPKNAKEIGRGKVLSLTEKLPSGMKPDATINFVNHQSLWRRGSSQWTG